MTLTNDHAGGSIEIGGDADARLTNDHAGGSIEIGGDADARLTNDHAGGSIEIGGDADARPIEHRDTEDEANRGQDQLLTVYNLKVILVTSHEWLG